jgi:DNA primase small subunit
MSSTFPRREFSMTIEPSPGQEVYIRYQSFSSRDDLASAVIKRRPTKIDIGAVFNHPPKDNKSLPPGRLRTVERELVFDIDLTDYDAVRNCGCRGAKICPKCWTYMGMAMEVMDAGLREDFGFEHVSWFYSGRRGVHCWVCDGAARGLSNEARSAVASYFEVRSTCLPFSLSLSLSLSLSRTDHPRLPSSFTSDRSLIPHGVHNIIPPPPSPPLPSPRHRSTWDPTRTRV